MFNISNLLITIGLATGVANTTPVCNTQKNENIIIDYQQTLTETSTSNFTYSYLNIPAIPSDYVPANECEDYEQVTRYTSNSSFLNILATKYTTINRETTNGNAFIQNYYTIQNNNDNYWRYTTTNMLVMQIDTYNFNVGTKIYITNKINVGNTQSVDLVVSNRRLLKQVYVTTDDNWSTYINRQLQIHLPEVIRSDIQNVNNNFFYTKEQTLTNVINAVSDQGYVYTDTTELNMTPNNRNYIVIEYIPVAEEKAQGVTNEDDQIMVLEDNTTGISQTNYRITGSNVIPDGNYEVIDIPGLMWQILTMPFAFVSQAFNLTLFPGTPYQVNISNLFLSILAILTFIGLISMILRMKG